MEGRERFARTILNGFESYFAEFQNITLAAKTRFENADWHGMRQASIQRIDLYKAKTSQVYEYVELIAGEQLRDYDFWRDARDVYSRLIEGHNNFEIAETFFNSMYCAVFKHRKIRNEYAFVFSPHGDMPPADVSKVYRTYRLKGPMAALLEEILTDYAFSIPYEDMQRDIHNIVGVIINYLAPRFDLNEDNVEFQVRQGQCTVQFYPFLLSGGCQYPIPVCAVPAAVDARQTHIGNIQCHGLQQTRQDLLPSLCFQAHAEHQ